VVAATTRFGTCPCPGLKSYSSLALPGFVCALVVPSRDWNGGVNRTAF
jgi:hypothetical protein